jgi:hypothetical protein
MDAYQLPDAKGFTSMLRTLVGETDAERQLLRDQLLSTSIDDFKQFADVLDAVKLSGKVVVMGSQAAIDAADADKGGWLEINKVL